MDQKVADAAEGPYKALVPSVFLGEHAPEGLSSNIDPDEHSSFRQGQFNAVSVYKLGAVRRVLMQGFQVIFSDVDVILLSDPVPALFPPPSSSPLPSSSSPPSLWSAAGVLLPLADFAYMQNVCYWGPGMWSGLRQKNKKQHVTQKTVHEGNTGFYFMRVDAPDYGHSGFHNRGRGAVR